MHIHNNSALLFSIVLFAACTPVKRQADTVKQVDAVKPSEKSKRYLGQTNTIRALAYSRAGDYREVDTPEVNRFLVLLGHDNGIEVTVTEHPIDLMKHNLERYDVLILSNSSALGKSLPEYARTDLKQWFEDGHGIFAIHTAEGSSKNWPWWNNLVGADFSADSDVMPITVVVDEGNKDHPAVAGFGPRFEINTSLHVFDKSVTGLRGIEVLLRADDSSYRPIRTAFSPGGAYYNKDNPATLAADHPIVWTNTAGKGRMLYTQMGHDVYSIDTDFGHKHFLESIKWVAEASVRDRSIEVPRRCDTPCPLYENRTVTPRESFYKHFGWDLDKAGAPEAVYSEQSSDTDTQEK